MSKTMSIESKQKIMTFSIHDFAEKLSAKQMFQLRTWSQNRFDLDLKAPLYQSLLSHHCKYEQNMHRYSKPKYLIGNMFSHVIYLNMNDISAQSHDQRPFLRKHLHEETMFVLKLMSAALSSVSRHSIKLEKIIIHNRNFSFAFPPHDWKPQTPSGAETRAMILVCFSSLLHFYPPFFSNFIYQRFQHSGN